MFTKASAFAYFVVLLIVSSLPANLTAGPLRSRGRRTQVYTPAVRSYPVPIRPIQNSFVANPVVYLQGNHDTGPGYSPLGLYGDQTMANYGPFSVYRARTTNVLIQTRGYDGVYRSTIGTTESYPNFTRPGMISSPTRANNFYKIRGPSGPRVPGDAINWLDLE